MVDEVSDQADETTEIREFTGRILSTKAEHQGKKVTYTQRELVDGTIAYYRSGRRLRDGRSINAAQHHLRRHVSDPEVEGRSIRSRAVRFKGDRITYSRRELKDGSVAYYRGKKRVKSRRLVGIAKTVLEGQGVGIARRQHPTPAEKAARRFREELGDRAPTSAAGIEEIGIPHIEKWAVSVGSAKKRTKHTFYVLIDVVEFQGGPGSHIDLHFDDPDEIDKSRTHPATLAIRGPGNQGLTKAQFQRDYEGLIREELDRHGLLLPEDRDVQDATVAVWRRKRE